MSRILGISKLKCPDCGQREFFCVQTLLCVAATAIGVFASDNPSTDPTSWCSCLECEHEGTVADFASAKKAVRS